MTRTEAIRTLASRLSGAPNAEHYGQWLVQQPDWLLIALASGKPVPFRHFQQAA